MSAKGRGSKPNPYDSYASPGWAIKRMVDAIDWGDRNGTFLEPCRGTGIICDIVEPYVGSMDWCEIQEGRDFLKYEPHKQHGFKPFDMCLTNPPFSIAQEFIDHALQMSDCVVMLQRLNFLGSKKRKEWWIKNTPTAVHVLSERPSFKKSDIGPSKTDSTEYCFLVWDKTGKQKTGLHWL